MVLPAGIEQRHAVLQTAALPTELQKHGDPCGFRTHNNLRRERAATLPIRPTGHI